MIRKGQFDGGRMKFGFRNIPKKTIIMEKSNQGVTMNIKSKDIIME